MAHRRSGYTLIELVIAIGLGLVLIYTAAAAMRVAAQSNAVATRMSLENNVLRAGFFSALDEVDFWTSYDDPADAGREALRANGLQFCSFSSAFPGGSAHSSMTPSPASEADIGWDGTYEWPVCDPRTWWTGNMAERYDTDLRMGDYSLFGNTAATAPHTWLYRQMEGLKNALGYEGFCEYLPPNIPYGYASSTNANVNSGKSLNEFLQESGPGSTNHFHNIEGNQRFVEGRYKCSKETSYAIFPLSPIGGSAAVNPQSNSRQFFLTGSNGATTLASAAQNETTFMNKAMSFQEIVPQRFKPDGWPSLSCGVARYLCYSRFVCLCKIRRASALTGEMIEVSFTAFGTTLRGARQQRLPGPPGSAPGWAHWYGTGDSRNTPTLDTY